MGERETEREREREGERERERERAGDVFFPKEQEGRSVLILRAFLSITHSSPAQEEKNI